MSASNAPIGVFDSGLGGLTVVHEIVRRLPGEGIVYLGDTARVPYGIRSPETVIRYAREGASFLLSRGIKLLVIACNTVSATGLREVAAESPVPVIGVIKPGARAAAAASRTRRVGVIGTEATVNSNAYQLAIQDIDPSIEVLSHPCPLFVPLVEEGWLEGEVPVLVAKRYLSALSKSDVDTLVLGCTHYPLLKPVIGRVMGSGVTLIDSATETSLEVSELLESRDELAGPAPSPAREFFVTDGPGKFRDVGQRFLGDTIEHIEKVLLEVCA